MQQNKDGAPKLLKQFGLFSVSLVLVFSQLNAGSFEDFKRSQNESFKKYKDERDIAFNKFLKSQWNAYSAKKVPEVYDKPKPEKIPKAKPQETKKVGPLVNVKVKEKPTKDKKPIEVKKPIVAEKQIDQSADKVPQKEISFDFFGTTLSFYIASDIARATFYPRNQEGISNYFDSVATSDYQDLIKSIKKVKKDMVLNDWGVYLLVNEISNRVYNVDDNSKLLSWFIFNKLGYAVKIGLAKKHVVMLFRSDKTIYSTPNYSFGKNKYYIISRYAQGGVGRLYSYKQNYPGSTNPLDLSINKLPNFVNNIKSKEIGFINNNKQFKVKINYNQNLIDFMGTYPQADYATFFNAPLENSTYTQLARAIKKEVDGKKMSEALNFVLHFVQKSFKYQMDNSQFGHEKVMFAQETLYYDKSDCEDRAVLFSNLIKDLFGIGVIGVKYKDHMATALYIPMDGDTVFVGKRRFVIADPTYINSSVGQSMPQYRPKKPESFIVVKE